MIIRANYILIDSAKMEGKFYEAKILNENCLSLYRGRSEEELAEVAPYLFTFPYSNEFLIYNIENGWGNSWGIVVQTKMIFEECWRHFRKFLLVKTEENQEFYFRFYDPRVLKIFLPTCDKNQILEFFGPIESFICEGDNKEEAIRFWHQNGDLKQEVLQAASFFGNFATDKLVQG